MLPPPLSSVTFSEIHHPQRDSNQWQSPRPLGRGGDVTGSESCPKTSGLFLLATTSCMKASGCLPGSTLSISLQPNGSHSSMNRLLYASLYWGCCSSLFCFQGWPKSQISQLSPLIPPAHTAFLLSDLTISSVTSNLELNYILGCVVLVYSLIASFVKFSSPIKL